MSNNVSTLDVCDLSYEAEKSFTTQPNALYNAEHLEEVKYLEPLEKVYDSKSGVCAVAYRDTRTGEIIIGYAGTNMDADGMKDVVTDVVSIGGSQGYHYDFADKFYKDIEKKYGNNIVVTGHSLGGNIAQYVAINNNADAIVYNAAPLYVNSTTILEQWLTFVKNPQFPIASLLFFANSINNRSEIEKMIKNYTGKITRITTEKDPLNGIMDPLGARYYGDEYIVPNSGGHNLDAIRNDPNQVEYINKVIEKENKKNILGKIRKGLAGVQKIKENLKNNNDGYSFSNGGISGTERIYLDAAQASVIVNGLADITENTVKIAKTKKSSAISSGEDIYNSLSHVPFDFIISSNQVREAYNEAGVNYSTIVNNIEEYCDDIISDIKNISDDFVDLETRIQGGIEGLLEKDSEIADLINGN